MKNKKEDNDLFFDHKRVSISFEKTNAGNCQVIAETWNKFGPVQEVEIKLFKGEIRQLQKFLESLVGQDEK